MTNKIIIDLDNTLAFTTKNYKNSILNKDLKKKINYYRKKGYIISIYTSRNMKTFKNNIGKINLNTLPTIINWLNKNKFKVDEIFVGKPWCGKNGFYVDDRSIRPDELIKFSPKKISKILSKKK